MTFSSSPVVPFWHLQRLTDTVGVIARADGIMPRHGDGCRVDDAARRLAVICRESSPSAELITLGRRYLYFLAQAQAADGKFRGQLGGDRRWRAGPKHGMPGAGPCGPWAPPRRGAPPRGSASRPGPGSTRAPWRVPRTRIRWRSRPREPPRYSTGGPAIPGALSLLATVGTVIGERAAEAAWPWPAARLSYANAAIAEAVIVAGHKLGRGHLLRNGLRMLDWLLAGETRNGHLSVVPAGGWGRGEGRPAFDQYPAEVAALADACARAAAVTGDSTWLTGVEMSVTWLLGDNDARVPMLDERTGGRSDAFGRLSRSRNQGAEATLAMLSVLQQGHRLAVTRPAD